MQKSNYAFKFHILSMIKKSVKMCDIKGHYDDHFYIRRMIQKDEMLKYSLGT